MLLLFGNTAVYTVSINNNVGVANNKIYVNNQIRNIFVYYIFYCYLKTISTDRSTDRYTAES